MPDPTRTKTGSWYDYWLRDAVQVESIPDPGDGDDSASPFKVGDRVRHTDSTLLGTVIATTSGWEKIKVKFDDLAHIPVLVSPENCTRVKVAPEVELAPEAEPVQAAAHFCTCDMVILLRRGCQCGGR